MARILLAWELGANTGHSYKLRTIAGTLVARGHDVVFAVQDIGTAPPGFETWQAPVWPGLLAPNARRALVQPSTMGDILAALGLASEPAMRAMIAAWDRLIAAVDPDVVGAEFAPGAMLAAHGRVPLLALGTGFSLPPPGLDRYPSLNQRHPVNPEAALLDGLNQALAANGRAALPWLPAIFAADRTIVAAFRELDPYREWRAAHGMPSVTPSRTIADGSGDEVFVYMNGTQDWPTALWQGIVDSGLKVRVHDPRLREADARTLEGAGLIVEREAVPFELIVARSRMVMSHGGLGLACSALLAGLPALFVPFDIEKRMVAACVAEMGLGEALEFDTIDAAGLANALRAMFHDATLGERSRRAAPMFRARLTRTCEEETADTIAEMLA